MTAKDLKNALLQEAVQGKLVPQIASEGNARDLLEEIRKERLSHGFANSYGICDGKNKKSKSTDLRSKSQISVTKKELPEITEEEIPFDIPESWCWCRLIDVLKDKPSNGISPKEVKYETKIRSLSLSATTSGVFDSNAFKYVELDNNTASKYWLKKNDLLIQRSNSRELVGTSCIYYGDDNLFIYPDLMMRMQVQQNIKLAYIDYVLKSPHVRNYFSKNASGTSDSMPKINQTIVCNTLIPLPPLSEQKRIVAAIEKFMPLIEEYGKKETELKAINEQICTLTKKAILQEAVQGKLVPQIAAEGNAKDLLEEIKKEKLSHGLDLRLEALLAINAKSGKKKSKKETALAGSNPCDISDDEVPFDIPENWCWCRLGEICNEIKRGKSPKYAAKSNFLAFAQKCNVKTGGIDLGLALYLDENSITRYSETDNLVQGDIVINSTGGGTMGRVGLYETQVPAGIKGVYPDSHVTVIRSIGNINQHYLYYVLKLNQPELEKCGTGSTNQTELKPAVLADFVIPLPPLAEQKRIVAAIEKMLPLCEKLGE